MRSAADDPIVKMMMQPTKQAFAELDRLKETGQKLVTEICETGKQLFPNHFAPKTCGTAFEFTLYGVKLLARIELPLNDNHEPRFSTYILDDDRSEEHTSELQSRFGT